MIFTINIANNVTIESKYKPYTVVRIYRIHNNSSKFSLTIKR